MSQREEVVTNGLVRSWPLPAADESGDKVSRGTVLVVAGSVRVPGAAMLAGLAALRVGAGRLMIATTCSTARPLGIALPEALVAGLPESAAGGIDPCAADEILAMAGEAVAVLIGPGLMDRDAVAELCGRVLTGLGSDPPIVVLDAAALTSLDLGRNLCADLGGRVVLTPNEGELATLAATDPAGPGERHPTDVARTAATVAAHAGAVVVVRGWICTPAGERWRHEAGTAALGTSGSGDVKAGVIAGIAGRGATPAQAGVWGAHVHARAGERLAARVGVGFLARELLDEIPQAVAEISS